ncbi:CAAX prenyl protease 2 [Echinococcus granulosus]|uniref:CAAX prenyl protease 2 n=1 Tax=Echinococcus granulosus TaxID=6210 RepID=W6U923_ECHGR|nr:CAAX prenyl protease 2 [Echinococcus granulosus]EUB57893.1 CAAX prenyl protease 2 [Echinococcus granulosus]
MTFHAFSSATNTLYSLFSCQLCQPDSCFWALSGTNGVQGGSTLCKLDYARELWYTSNLIRLRNIVIAPLVEEIIFRGCILFHLQRRFDSCGALCLGSSLLFAVSHFHHVVERIYAGYAVREALLDVLSQVLMTAMFGAYSTLLVLRSGHLAAAFAVHSLCNLMGMPDIAGEMRVAEIHDPRWGRCVYKALLLVGFISWLVLIGPASTLFGLSDSTLCRLP